MPKTEHNEGFICPYCGYLNAPAWMFNGACEQCHRLFLAWEETTTTYYAADCEGGRLLKDVLHTKEIKS